MSEAKNHLIRIQLMARVEGDDAWLMVTTRDTVQPATYQILYCYGWTGDDAMTVVYKEVVVRVGMELGEAQAYFLALGKRLGLAEWSSTSPYFRVALPGEFKTR